jgi:hypothetical protein
MSSFPSSHRSAAGGRRAVEGALAGAIIALSATTLPALAAEAAPRQAQGAPRIDCTCRANGHSYHLGERVCLSTPRGFRIAECRMSQNVTSWAVGGEDCVVSAMPSAPLLPDGRS